MNESENTISSILNNHTSVAGNCTSGYFPYYQSSISTFYDNSFNIFLKKVENGWILKKENKEFICTDLEDIVKILKEGEIK